MSVLQQEQPHFVRNSYALYIFDLLQPQIMRVMAPGEVDLETTGRLSGETGRLSGELAGSRRVELEHNGNLSWHRDFLLLPLSALSPVHVAHVWIKHVVKRGSHLLLAGGIKEREIFIHDADGNEIVQIELRRRPSGTFHLAILDNDNTVLGEVEHGGLLTVLVKMESILRSRLG